MNDGASFFLDLHEANKLTTIECETGLLIVDQLQRLINDAESKHYTDGLKYAKDFVARIVLSMIPMTGRNWNLRGCVLILNMKRDGTIIRLGQSRFDFSNHTTHEFVVTLSEQPNPRWHSYVPGFLKFMLKKPVMLSPIYEIKKRAITEY